MRTIRDAETAELEGRRMDASSSSQAGRYAKKPGKPFDRQPGPGELHRERSIISAPLDRQCRPHTQPCATQVNRQPFRVWYSG
jgi:hypothetical protein